MCRALQEEFPDVSISKIRYLEDQGLLAPRRTQGGYRLFAEEDVERLRTILRLQRDEFLPLRVIRQELASPTATSASAAGRSPSATRRTRSTWGSSASRSGVTPEVVRELEGFGLLDARAGRGYTRRATPISPRRAPSSRVSDWPRGTCARSAPSAEREAALLEQVAAPALRARNPERRKRALDDLTDARGARPAAVPAALRACTA